MGKGPEQRERLLRLARILYEETDTRHPLPINTLLDRLSRQGIQVERKSLYRDFDCLKHQGTDVRFRGGLEGGWYVEDRLFTPEDLRAVVDAIAVYGWLPQERRTELTEKLTLLAPRPQRGQLRRPVRLRHPAGIPREETRGVLDKIHTALQQDRMLSFLPVTYDRQGARCPASQRILVSPKAIVWEGEQYLLLAWDDGSQTLHRFRLDRMEEVTVTGCPAKGGQALLPPWAPFGEGTGLNRARVRLLCRESAVGDLLDCFGYDLPMEPKGDGLMVTADVTVTGDFWGWLVARNGQVEVAGPPWLAKLWELCYRPRTVE